MIIILSKDHDDHCLEYHGNNEDEHHDDHSYDEDDLYEL